MISLGKKEGQTCCKKLALNSPNQTTYKEEGSKSEPYWFDFNIFEINNIFKSNKLVLKEDIKKMKTIQFFLIMVLY